MRRRPLLGHTVFRNSLDDARRNLTFGGQKQLPLFDIHSNFVGYGMKF